MKRRLKPTESFLLYAILLAGVLAFYVMGLLIGREQLHRSPPPAVDLSGPRPPVRNVQPELKFFDQLMEGPRDEGRTPVPKTEDAPPAAEPLLAPPPEISGPEPEEPGPEPPAQGAYTIQVGALNSEEEARQLLLRLEVRNYMGRLETPRPGGDGYYRVWVGEFASPEEARSLEQDLKEDGFHTYLRKIPSQSVGP